MPNQAVQEPKITEPKAKAVKPLRLPVLYGFVMVAVIAVGLELILLPNLASNFFFLVLVVFTTLLSFTSLGLSLSGVRSRMPVAAKWGVSLVLWSFVALDIIFLALPSILPGQTANDANPFASNPKPAAQATIAPTTQSVTNNQAVSAQASPTTAPTLEPTQSLAPATALTIAQIGQAQTPVATATTTKVAATATPVPVTAIPVPPTVVPKPVTFSGNFNNAGPEPVSGRAILGKTAEGKLILRFENFQSHPGPDLIVYLTNVASPADGQVKAGLQIGKLRATQGNQNYELDSSLDISQYKAVVVYCKAFSVVFGYANLAVS